ncbi:hypothetical protein GEV33_003372 [Tenebrio molitor]|uniref:Uncharacterized protein n=1 Tax=Tenebrio molitor TaxID=7067 RepID=A0A8J6HRB9_TENMO|nr:hypothetical protein GEV33_003372 [Tenebrio molitor]
MGMELLSATASSGVSGAREIATSQNVHITPPIRFPIEEAVEQKAEVESACSFWAKRTSGSEIGANDDVEVVLIGVVAQGADSGSTGERSCIEQTIK